MDREDFKKQIIIGLISKWMSVGGNPDLFGHSSNIKEQAELLTVEFFDNL